MTRDVLLSLIDQALNSAFSLLLSLAFIAFATPSEFGRFAFLLAGSFFAGSAQNALVVMPLNYLLPGRPEEESEPDLSMLTSVNAALALVILAFSLLLAALVDADLWLAAATAIFVLSQAQREYQRNILVVRGRMVRALGHGATAVGGSALAVAGLWQLLPPEAAALAGLAVGNLLAMLVVRVDLKPLPGRFLSHLAAYRRIWRDTRWALQGALQAEVIMRSYVFLVERFRDTATLGTLNAGRTVMSPLMLVAFAWCRVARPRLVVHRARNEGAPARRLALAGSAVVFAAALVFGAVLVLLWPWLEAYAFRGRYADMPSVVGAWWLYALVAGQTLVASTLLESRRAFRPLAIVGAVSAVLTPLSLAVLLASGGPAAAAALLLAATSALSGLAYVSIAISGRTFAAEGAT